jgi:hypothetical protein
MVSVPETTKGATPTSGEPFVFPSHEKCWSPLHRYFEPSRSHNWVTGMVVFHSDNLECNKCFKCKHCWITERGGESVIV